MILAIVAALALLASPAADTLPGSVRGELRSERTGAPLGGATVEMLDLAGRRALASDSAGGYLLRRVPAGRRVVRASRMDHEPLEVEVWVPAGGQVTLDLVLRPRAVPLAGIRVQSRPAGAVEDSAAARPPVIDAAGIAGVGATPGIAELGLGEARGRPGQSPADPSDVLYVRGAPTDLKLVLLDGAPVYTPFHLAGLLPSFEAGLLRSASLHLGGAPARYDGGLSYILNLSTRPGREGPFRSSGAVDGAAAQMTGEGSLGPGVRLLAGGRAIHGVGIAPLLDGPLPFSYREGLLRLDAEVGHTGLLSVTAFHNREGVRFDSAARGAGWGNRALALRLRLPVAGADAEVGAALSGFDAVLPPASTPSPTRGTTARARVTADLARDVGPVRLGYGGSWDRLDQRFHSPHREPGVAERRLQGDAAGVYLDALWSPAPRLRLRAGTRADFFSVDPAPQLAPRLSATWLLSERAALTAAAGRFHQYVRISEPVLSPREEGGADTLFLPAALAVGRASHVSLGLQQETDPGVRLGVEGFFKSFEGVGPADEAAYASGLDLWLRRDTGALRGWVGYSLSWIWSLPEASRSAVSQRFAGRQLLNAGATGALPGLADVGFRLAYGAGLPLAGFGLDQAASVDSEFQGEPASLAANTRGAADAPPLLGTPDAPFLRLDLELSRTFTRRWHGRSVEIAPYLKVLNALDRRDGLFYRPDVGDGSALSAVAPLPLLPVFGVSWKF
jgi:hypothetical protein